MSLSKKVRLAVSVQQPLGSEGPGSHLVLGAELIKGEIGKRLGRAAVM